MAISRGIIVGVVLSLSLATGRAEEPAYLQTRVLSLALANQLALNAAQHCRRQGYQVAVAVVDRGGRLLSFVRDPLAGAHTIEVAQRKAFSAATFQTSTLDLQGRGGMQRLNSVSEVLLVGGGVPVQVGGRFYGAVGVSGAPAEQVTGDVDHACAEAGIASIRETLEFAE